MKIQTIPHECSIPCNLCGSKHIQPIKEKDRNGNFLRSVICQHCGLVWTDPRPTQEEERVFYSQEYRLSYKGTYEPKPKHIYRAGKVAIDRLNRVQEYLKKDWKLLDIGSGSGEFVYVLHKLGYLAEGIEPNEGYAHYARDVLEVSVTQGFYQDITIQYESKDMITIFHAVEHLENPFEIMRYCYRWLKREGILWIEVPNVEACCQYPNTQFHRGHLYHFNLLTLDRMMRKAGFVIMKGFTSSDGGNITVVGRKSETKEQDNCEIEGNYEKVSCILRRHTVWRHLFSVHPYVRPLRKFLNRIEEKRGIKNYVEGKILLDNLIEKEIGKDA